MEMQKEIKLNLIINYNLLLKCFFAIFLLLLLRNKVEDKSLRYLEEYYENEISILIKKKGQIKIIDDRYKNNISEILVNETQQNTNTNIINDVFSIRLFIIYKPLKI